MSRRKRESIAAASGIGLGLSNSAESNNQIEQNERPKTGVVSYLRARLWLVGLIAVLSLGALGAGLKYLEEDSKREIAKAPKDRSMLSSVNPFVPAPPPPPTMQHSKSYIYAGSRLLAVEDANASAVPPADLAIWRPSNGLWCVFGGPGSTQTIFGWGNNSDVPAPGDYDGDGKTDFAVYRKSMATFWIMKSSDNTYYAVTQGTIDLDVPVPGDYDGDGKTDTALFRASNSTWHIVKSSDSSGYNFTWGASGDKTAQADYDGDGKTDAAIWRGNELNFYILKSSDNNWTYAYLGTAASADTPVSADYDGDGKADPATLSGNNWIIKSSSTGTITPVQWQNVNDIPVPNDYDGDGKVDIASWRNSNGNWYIRQSAHGNSLRNVAWGTAGDIPVPALYRR